MGNQSHSKLSSGTTQGFRGSSDGEEKQSLIQLGFFKHQIPDYLITTSVERDSELLWNNWNHLALTPKLVHLLLFHLLELSQQL